MPLSGLVSSHLFLGEAFLFRHAVSLALVLAGIAVMERGRGEESRDLDHLGRGPDAGRRWMEGMVGSAWSMER